MKIDIDSVRFLDDRASVRELPSARAQRGGFSWTPEQDELIRSLAGKLNDRQIGERVGRSGAAVRMRAAKLKVSLRISRR